MIHLNPTEIEMLLDNMSADDSSQVRSLALLESPKQAEFADEHGEHFSHYTVYEIWEAARSRSFYCYSCEMDKAVSEWSRDSSCLDLCADCMDAAELENEHSDSGHPKPVANCPSCVPMQSLAEAEFDGHGGDDEPPS